VSVLVALVSLVVAQIDPPTPDAEHAQAEAPVDSVEVDAARVLAASSTTTTDAPSGVHLCKIEALEALKLLSKDGANVWRHGSYVYSNLGEHAVENGIAECKLLCDEDASCHRWVYSCETRMCRYHDYGGMLHDEDNTYSFVGEANDIGAKVNLALQRAKDLAEVKAKEEEETRKQAEADKQAETQAQAKAQVDVTAAEKKAAAMRNRRLGTSAATVAPGAAEAEPEGEL